MSHEQVAPACARCGLHHSQSACRPTGTGVVRAGRRWWGGQLLAGATGLLRRLPAAGCGVWRFFGRIRGACEIRGRVLSIEGPHDRSPPVDGWKWATWLLWGALSLPWLLALYLVRLVADALFDVLVGRSSHPAGRTLFDEIVLHQVLGRVIHRRSKGELWHVVVADADRRIAVRQIGSLAEGILQVNRPGFSGGSLC